MARGATNLSARPATYEDNVNLVWAPGLHSVSTIPMTGYTIYYRAGTNGGETPVGVGLITTALLDLSHLPRGQTVSFRIVTWFEDASSLTTGWTSPIRRNRTPHPAHVPKPVTLTVAPGTNLAFNFGHTGDPDGNEAGYELEAEGAGIVGSSARSPLTISTSQFALNSTRRFRIRCFDEYGQRGAWSPWSDTVTFNVAPSNPTINYPVQGSTIYNQHPRICLQAGSNTGGNTNTLIVADPNPKSTATHGVNFSCGIQGNLTSGRRVVYRPPNTYRIGAAGIGAYMVGDVLQSDQAKREFYINQLAFTDPVLQRGMYIKAVHITQLQNAIGNLRRAYGQSAVSWQACVAGTTPIANAGTHISQMQNALQGVLTAINGWDSTNSTFDISVTWISVTSGAGVDAKRLREAIEQLREVVAEI